MHLPNMLSEMVKRRVQLPRIVYLSFLIRITQIKQNQKLSWQCFLRALTSQTHIHGALQGRIKVQQVGILISRKQRSECERRPCWAAVEANSSTRLCYYSYGLFSLADICFTTWDGSVLICPTPLRCGRSHRMDLLIQLVFFDASSSPHYPILFLPSPSPALLSVAFTVASNLWLLLSIGPVSRNQSNILGIVCRAPGAGSLRWPAQCDCWNVPRGLMSLIPNRTKSRQIYLNWILTHI